MKTLVYTTILFLFAFFGAGQDSRGFKVPKSANPTSGTTYALIVGISNYSDPQIPSLQFADRDALAFCDFLLQTGVDTSAVTLLLNEKAKSTDIMYALDDLCIEKAQKGDKIFFYFSGHGDVESRMITNLGYLLPYDSPSKIYSIGAIKVRDVQDLISTASAKGVQVILIIDACHAGKLAGGNEGMANVQNVLKETWVDEIKMLSCQPGELSLEGLEWGNGRGLFSYELIDGLAGKADKNNDGMVNVNELSLYLEDRVPVEAHPVQQFPIVTGNSGSVVSKTNAQFVLNSDMAMANELASIEFKGFENSLLHGLDDSVSVLVDSFLVALDSGRLVCSVGFDNYQPNCAYDYLRKIRQHEGTAYLQALLGRNLCASIMQNFKTITALREKRPSRTPNTIELYDFNERALVLEEILGKTKIFKSGFGAQWYFMQAQHFFDLDENSFDWENDLSKIDTALFYDSQASYLYHFLCMHHFDEGEYRKSISNGLKALEITPGYTSAYNFLSMSYQRLGVADSSNYYLRLILSSFDPQDDESYLRFVDDKKIDMAVNYELLHQPDSVAQILSRFDMKDSRKGHLYDYYGFYQKLIRHFTEVADTLAAKTYFKHMEDEISMQEDFNGFYELAASALGLGDKIKCFYYLEKELQKCKSRKGDCSYLFDFIHRFSKTDDIEAFKKLTKKYSIDKK